MIKALEIKIVLILELILDYLWLNFSKICKYFWCLNLKELYIFIFIIIILLVLILNWKIKPNNYFFKNNLNFGILMWGTFFISSSICFYFKNKDKIFHIFFPDKKIFYPTFNSRYKNLTLETFSNIYINDEVIKKKPILDITSLNHFSDIFRSLKSVSVDGFENFDKIAIDDFLGDNLEYLSQNFNNLAYTTSGTSSGSLATIFLGSLIFSSIKMNILLTPEIIGPLCLNNSYFLNAPLFSLEKHILYNQNKLYWTFINHDPEFIKLSSTEKWEFNKAYNVFREGQNKQLKIIKRIQLITVFEKNTKTALVAEFSEKNIAINEANKHNKQGFEMLKYLMVELEKKE